MTTSSNGCTSSDPTERSSPGSRRSVPWHRRCRWRGRWCRCSGSPVSDGSERGSTTGSPATAIASDRAPTTRAGPSDRVACCDVTVRARPRAPRRPADHRPDHLRPQVGPATADRDLVVSRRRPLHRHRDAGETRLAGERHGPPRGDHPRWRDGHTGNRAADRPLAPSSRTTRPPPNGASTSAFPCSPLGWHGLDTRCGKEATPELECGRRGWRSRRSRQGASRGAMTSSAAQIVAISGSTFSMANRCISTVMLAEQSSGTITR